MKILYFLGLVLFCQAAPTDSPPTNVKSEVGLDGNNPFFILTWERPVTTSDNPILSWNVKCWTGKTYVNYATKEDGTKVTEVVVPQAPEKPITELGEYEVSADKTNFRFDEMKRGTLYECGVQGKYKNGLGALSEKCSFSMV